MGESKRRKMLDPNYGKQTQKVSSFISELEKDYYDLQAEFYLEHKQAVLNSDRLSDSEYNFLKEKEELTEKEQNQLKRAKIERTYGISLTDDLITKDDNGWYLKIRLHYFLTVGNQFLADYEKKQLNDTLKHNDEKIFLPDFNCKLLSAKINTLKLLNIEQFLDKNRKFTEYDFYLWFENLKDQSLILDVTDDIDDDNFISNKHKWLENKIHQGLYSPMTIACETASGFAKEVLDELGLTLIKQRGVYQCFSLDDGRGEVFERWLERDRESIERSFFGGKSLE